MASSSPPSCFSSFDPINCTVTVSQRQFNAFHSIDRTLFTRLLVSLGREANEAMQVVAYILWLEKISRDLNIVARLITASDSLLHDLVGEVVLALVCMETDQLPHESNPMKDLRLTQSITNTNLNFPYLLHNRVAIIGAITKLIDDVCIRAFTDIVQRALIQRTLLNPMVHPLYFDPSSSAPPDHLHQHHFVVPPPQQHHHHHHRIIPPPPPPTAAHHNNNWCGGGHHGPSSILRGLEVGSSSCGGVMRSNVNVPPDERTIFLTFSKGYFVSEPELRDYFSRRYGDMIEEVYMQEVEMMEQPLYARLVVRWNAIHLIDRVLEGRVKVKFSINGKHVWARKYVRKTTKSPPNSPSASSSSPSPSPHPHLL